MHAHIQALFYAEFDNVQGPKIVYQTPEGFLGSLGASVPPADLPSSPVTQRLQQQQGEAPGPEDTDGPLAFDSISEYIIPKPELCGRLVTIFLNAKYKVLGYPVLLEGPKYERNNLLFNLCFVFERHDSTGEYEQVVRKIARELQNLELESDLIHNPSSKPKMLSMMEQLHHDLNTYFECQVRINNANTLNVKLFPEYSQPPKIFDYQVPILVSQLETEKTWDLSVQKIIPFINGVNHIKKISDLADVDILLARQAVQHLAYYGCIKLIDIFQFSNTYTVNQNIKLLPRDLSLQSECVKFVSRYEQQSLPFATLFTLYCSLRIGVSLKSWIEENGKMIPYIDIRKFIIFGVVKEFVYRLHRYPVFSAWDSGKSSGSSSMDAIPRQEVMNRLKKYLDGRHHYDELCTRFGCSVKELDELLLTDPTIHFLLRA